MAKELKVYRFGDGKNEIICAVYTKKQACELFGISLNDLNKYSSITSNPEQVKLVTENPGKAYFRKNFSNEPYVPYKDRVIVLK